MKIGDEMITVTVFFQLRPSILMVFHSLYLLKPRMNFNDLAINGAITLTAKNKKGK